MFRFYQNYYLLINEIDRGQINEIFGETITILATEERNISQTILSKSGRKFSLPKNLCLIATMSLSGQEKLLSDPILNSIFSIIELQPETKLLEKLKLVKKEQEFSPLNLEELLQTINTKIADLAGREKLIGHCYFLDLKTLEEFYQLWYFRLLPWLKSNWGGNPEQLFFIAGKKFFNSDLSLNFLNYRTPGLSEFEVAIKEISNLRAPKKI